MKAVFLVGGRISRDTVNWRLGYRTWGPLFRDVRQRPEQPACGARAAAWRVMPRPGDEITDWIMIAPAARSRSAVCTGGWPGAPIRAPQILADELDADWSARQVPLRHLGATPIHDRLSRRARRCRRGASVDHDALRRLRPCRCRGARGVGRGGSRRWKVPLPTASADSVVRHRRGDRCHDVELAPRRRVWRSIHRRLKIPARFCWIAAVASSIPSQVHGAAVFGHRRRRARHAACRFEIGAELHRHCVKCATRQPPVDARRACGW